MRIALASLLLVGCVASNDGTDGTDTGTGTGTGTGSGSGSGSADTTPPPAPVASGAFQVRSDIDLTVEAVLPESAANAVQTLRDFQANPARTLFDLAEDAGVPAVAKIREELPDYVEEKIEGWINEKIATLTLGGVPVQQTAGQVVALAETTMTKFAIESEMTIGDGTVTHTLTALDFTPAGIETQIAFAGLPGDITTATTTCETDASTITIGDHGYSIAYGEYAWRAVEAAFAEQYGIGIRDGIHAAMSCEALATTISEKCYWGYCVGHKAELTEICTRGVDEAIDRAYAKVAEHRFDLVHFLSGTAQLVDADGDLVAEALAAGAWDAEINAGMGLRHVPATFSATK